MELLMRAAVRIRNKKNNMAVVTCPVRFETTAVVVNCASTGRLWFRLSVCLSVISK
jgi:hypothetical protein